MHEIFSIGRLQYNKFHYYKSTFKILSNDFSLLSVSTDKVHVFIRSLLGVDRFSLSWGSGRGLLEVYEGWTDAASAGDLEEVY